MSKVDDFNAWLFGVVQNQIKEFSTPSGNIFIVSPEIISVLVRKAREGKEQSPVQHMGRSRNLGI